MSSPTLSFSTLFAKVLNRENLTAADAEALMQIVLSGQASTAQIAGLLVALRMKGETPDEVLGFARAMRAKAVRVSVDLDAGEPLLDTCGTGGDGSMTFNISTVAALVIAGAGVKVAKHGNRSLSSQCGSADILEGLGVRIELSPELVAESIRETGFGFFYAPAIHPAVRFAQEARLQLKIRTVFNLLGPLTNPAGATVQIAGAPSVRAAELIAEALASLGLFRGFVVHGMDGLDEITTTTESLVLEIRGGAIAHHHVTPEDFGVKRAKLSELQGGDRLANCGIARRVIAGETGAARDIVLVNASAGLVAAGVAADFAEGAAMAARSIDSGAALRVLERVVTHSHDVLTTAGR
ncbi:MAG: anthranilate phosphoribosyltransferase [Bryobacteraceae bacterium]|nr:anthranilate phosphoribosyltransferase [Bryobacteraceae bacterium]